MLDSNHSTNMTSNQNQMVYTENLYNLYNVVFDTFSKFKDVGIIIKTKKNIVLKSLKDIYKKAEVLEKKGSCYIIKEPFTTYISWSKFECFLIRNAVSSLPKWWEAINKKIIKVTKEKNIQDKIIKIDIKI